MADIETKIDQKLKEIDSIVAFNSPKNEEQAEAPKQPTAALPKPGAKKGDLQRKPGLPFSAAQRREAAA